MRLRFILLSLLPLAALLTIWQLLTGGMPERQFIFSSPAQIAAAWWHLALEGTLWRHTFVTLTEVILGFVIGTSVGTALGVSFWFSPTGARIAKPYIVALAAIPIFALAPVTIIWFGIGIFSKIMMATLATVFVALFQAYQGVQAVDERYLKLMHVMQASRWQVFRHVVFPSAWQWVLNAIKLNIGFAIMGAFIGEFIAAQAGLGYMIVRATGLYDMATVYAGCITLMVMSLILTALVGLIQKNKARKIL